MIVDAHQHLWRTGRGDYGWIPEGDAVLDRDYLPSDLSTVARAAGVTQTVLVQAAPTTAETEYMLGLADGSDLIAGVVGWIDFEDPGARRTLDRFARHPKFLGVRPMVQDIADPDWVVSPDIDWAFDAVEEMDLTFDALGLPIHGSRFLARLTRHPDLRVVLDHGLKPQIADGGFDDWAPMMQDLADNTSACCKLSGLITEAGADVTAETLRPYSDHILTAFGPDRVMWGSDWPVSRLRMEYGDWLGMAQRLCAGLSERDRAKVFADTARKAYRL